MPEQISLQFQNIAAGLNDGARFTTEGSWQFFVTQSPEEINNNPRTNIDPMIDPILSEDSDIVSFSEVFGTIQRDYIQKKLEQLGYTVHVTSAFEMWSQDTEDEHLYNVIGIKEDKLGKPFTTTHKKFRNKRKIEGVVFAMNYLFPVLPYSPKNKNISKVISHTKQKIGAKMSGESFEETSAEIEKVRSIHNRLANGILDGAISFFEFDSFVLATGHVHKFNEEVISEIQRKIAPGKAFVLLGDMNVKRGDDLLMGPPFGTPDWKSILGKETRTFGFRPGGGFSDEIAMRLSHFQPDVAITRGFDAIRASAPQSLSDHNGVSIKLKPTSQSAQ